MGDVLLGDYGYRKIHYSISYPVMLLPTWICTSGQEIAFSVSRGVQTLHQ